MNSAKNLIFEARAEADIAFWSRADKKYARKIWKLLEEIKYTPYTGTGKPEALKHDFSGCWSRRIDKEHRLVYRVEDNAIIVLPAAIIMNDACKSCRTC